jgi:release factor glutamine methyltransferase
MTTAAITARGLLAAASVERRGDESARDVELLLGHALGKDRSWLYAHADDALSVDSAGSRSRTSSAGANSGRST